MAHSQPSPSDANQSVDDISDFLKDYSISLPSRQALVFGTTYGSSAAPATDHSRHGFPIPAHPPQAPTPHRRTYTGTSASTAPSMTSDVGSYSSSFYTGQSYADSMPPTVSSLGSTVLPGNSEYVLPCEFIGYDSCDQYFNPVDADQWMNHIIVDHLQSQLPNKSNCWFCESISFDARKDHTDRASSFRNRLDHIRLHIRDERLGIRNMRPDYDFLAHIWKLRLISRNACEAARGWREGPAPNVTRIFPDGFIPEDQIQRYESQGVIVREPRARARIHKHRSQRQHWEHSRKSSGFGMPVDTLSPTLSPPVKQYDQSDSSSQMALNTSRSQSPRSLYQYLLSLPPRIGIDHEIPKTSAEDTSNAGPAATTIDSSIEPLSQLSDKHSGSSIPVQQTALPSHRASQDDQVTKHEDVFARGTDDEDYFNCGTDNEDNFECETDDENNFQDAGSLPQSGERRPVESEPVLDKNRRMDGDIDLESRSSKTIDSKTGHPEDSPAKSQHDASLSQSAGSPEPGGTLTPDSCDSLQGDNALYTSPFNRQVGVARLRIEQLSLFDRETTHCAQYADVSTHSGGSHNEHDDCPADAGLEAFGGQRSGPSGAPPERPCSTTKRPRLNTENETEAEDSDPDEDQRRTEPDQKKQKSGYEGPRFACPYQAFEPFQNCFEPRALNSTGGCKNIPRLKQHLSRRHKQANRCCRCWSYFDSRERAKYHETKNQCEHRAMSQTERFMNAQSEAGIENACRSVPAIEAWWNLFRLLIPGMQGRDLESLIQQYGPNYPYYSRRGPNLIIPSVTLSNNFFEPVPQAGPSQETVFNRNSDHQTLLTPRNFNLDTASTTYAMQPVSSQTFSVPVFQGLDVEAAGNSFINLYDTAEASGSAQGSSSLDFASSSSNLHYLLEMPFMPENTASASSAGNQGQLQRNYERLRKRNIQAEADIVTSRQAVQEAGSDFTLMDNIFEDLLNSGDLPEKLFDKISEASSALTSARRKLQRAAL